MPQFYELIDSGDGRRLERFGNRTLIRPSKFSVWKPRENEKLWADADASYVHKAGWKYKSAKFQEWVSKGDDLSLKLKLQENGQIGFFPEHVAYLPDIREALRRQQASKPKVLNLFAYTGMASIAALQEKADVTHVDLSKKVLDWAKENFELNGLSTARFIREDAVTFMEREVRRGNLYDVVIADPPSFSRVSDNNEWKLEEVLTDLIELCVSLLKAEGATLFLTSHHFESGGHVMANILLDSVCRNNRSNPSLSTKELSIAEVKTGRVLPAGFLVQANW